MLIQLPAKIAFSIAVVLIIALFLPEWFSQHRAFFVGEFGMIEIITATAYASGCAVAIKGALNSTGLIQKHFMLWALMTFVFLGEETSWFQHYLGYATPTTLVEMNAQKEFNLHNIQIFHGGSIIDMFRGRQEFDILLLLKPAILFNIGFVAYFLLLPLVYFISSTMRNLAAHFYVPVLSFNMVLMVWVPCAVSVLLVLLEFGTRNYAGETREMYYGITMLLFLWIFYRQTRPLPMADAAKA